jgi:hypothetical protein
MKLVASVTSVEGPFRAFWTLASKTRSLGKKYNKRKLKVVFCVVFPHATAGDDHGVRRADTVRAHARWRNLVGYALSADVPRAVSSRQHGRHNHRRIRYIVLHRI